MIVFYLCALWNIHVFAHVMLMCPIKLKHFICLNLILALGVLAVACTWSVILMVVCTLIGLLVLCIFGRYCIMLIYGILVPPEVYMHEELKMTYKILDQEYRKEGTDKTLFVKEEKGRLMTAQIYVDDSVFGGMSNQMVQHFVHQIQSKFGMRLMGELTYLLGIQVKQMEDTIFVFQIKYAKMFGMDVTREQQLPLT
jgi:hypothetical protein